MKRLLKTAIGVAGSLLFLSLLLAGVYRSYGPGEPAERLARLQQRWNPFFGAEAAVTWGFIGKGVLITLQLAVISMVLSLIFGVLLALMRLARHPYMTTGPPRATMLALSVPAGFLVQIVRAAPLYMLIIYSFIAAPRLGIDMPPPVAGVFALTLYTSSVLAEIMRAGILSLDRGQFEAALSLGLSYPKRLRLVILPQGLRRMLPAVVSQLVTLMKDTSLLHVITILEVYRRVALLSQQNFNPIESFLVAALIFFAINFALSSFAKRLELRPAAAGSASQAAIQQIGAEDQTRVIERP